MGLFLITNLLKILREKKIFHSLTVLTVKKLFFNLNGIVYPNKSVFGKSIVSFLKKRKALNVRILGLKII